MKERIPLCVCFNGLTMAHDSVDRTLLWRTLASFGVPQNMISVIRQFYDGRRASVRLDDRVCSEWFAMEQGLRQKCVLVYTSFKANKDIIGVLVHLRKKAGAGGQGEATSGEPVLETSL